MSEPVVTPTQEVPSAGSTSAKSSIWTNYTSSDDLAWGWKGRVYKMWKMFKNPYSDIPEPSTSSRSRRPVDTPKGYNYKELGRALIDLTPATNMRGL